MSCNYADGLSPYADKGVLGIPEKLDSLRTVHKKCEILAEYIKQSQHVVVHTGAGISTSAGIPDFRGPNGVWTLEKKGKKPTTNISFADAKPTKTHMILKDLVERRKVAYIISQNIDGLHLKSGLERQNISELHGNMFVEECNHCKRQFVRDSPVMTVGRKSCEKECPGEVISGKQCDGRLFDVVLDWEDCLPEDDLLMAEWHSSLADLSICLGTTLQIVPSGNLPLQTVKFGGRLVICNLQSTKYDDKADLVINYYVDDVLEKVMTMLGLKIPTLSDTYESLVDLATETVIDWTINKRDVARLEWKFKSRCKKVKKRRVPNKRKTKHVVNKGPKSKTCKLDEKNKPTDSGETKSESGEPENVPGETENDPGEPENDSGASENDSGAPENDSGAPENDSSESENDSSASENDSRASEHDSSDEDCVIIG